MRSFIGQGPAHEGIAHGLEIFRAGPVIDQKLPGSIDRDVRRAPIRPGQRDLVTDMDGDLVGIDFPILHQHLKAERGHDLAGDTDHERHVSPQILRVGFGKAEITYLAQFRKGNHSVGSGKKPVDGAGNILQGARGKDVLIFQVRPGGGIIVRHGDHAGDQFGPIDQRLVIGVRCPGRMRSSAGAGFFGEKNVPSHHLRFFRGQELKKLAVGAARKWPAPKIRHRLFGPRQPGPDVGSGTRAGSVALSRSYRHVSILSLIHASIPRPKES